MIREPNPASDLLQQLIHEGVSASATDIHIEPQLTQTRVRMRQQGKLCIAHSLPLPLAEQIIIHIKVLAQLNIAEKRLPQDGSILFNEEQGLNIRVSTCPTIYGEKIALRLLNYQLKSRRINELGMDEKQQTLFQSMLSQHQGLILIVGPTGSGKTTTLYSALSYLNHSENNIVTIEDPVEIKLEGITQININPRLKFGFAAALRALLRQDPDVIMIGEIRDTETAAMAIQAAQTGHLVLSTIHGNSTIDAINRLRCLGISTSLLNDVLLLTVTQSLSADNTATRHQFQLTVY